jgi:hypothetical protein
VVISPDTPGLELFETAAGRWEYLWITDQSVGGAGLGQQVRILKRLGTVIDISGLEPPAAAALLAPHGPKGIIGLDDLVVLRAAQLGHELALTANSVETVHRYTNKHLQREALEAAGLPVPQHWTIPAGADKDLIEEITESVGYPAILKPQSGRGSRETHRVDDATAARAILSGDGGGVIEDLIVEEYLRDGWPRAERPYADMVSVESIVIEGRVNHLAVTGRATLVDPFREAGNFIPSTLDARRGRDGRGARRRDLRDRGNGRDHRGGSHRDQADARRSARDRGERPDRRHYRRHPDDGHRTQLPRDHVSRCARRGDELRLVAALRPGRLLDDLAAAYGRDHAYRQ